MSANMPLAPMRKSSAFSHGAPSSSFINASHSSDCFAVRIVFANRTRHHQAHRQRGVDSFFSRRRFDEIGAGHHGYDAGPRNVAQREQVAASQNHFHVRVAAGGFECGDFVVQRLPAPAENVRAGDDHVNFVRARLHGAPDFRHALVERRKSRGKSRRNRGDFDPASLQRAKGCLHESVINAYRRHFDV